MKLGMIALLMLASPLTAQVGTTVSDNFEDGVLDNLLWRVVLPGTGGASVTESGGHAVLANRGYLVTQSEFDPSVLGDIVVRGRWRFAEVSSTGNIFTVMIRTDAVPTGQYGVAQNGLEFSSWFVPNSGPPGVGLGVRGDGFSLSNYSASFSAFTWVLGVDYDFEIVDRGASVSCRIQRVGEPGNYGEVSCNVTSTYSGPKYVAFHCREEFAGANTAWLDDVEIGPVRNALVLSEASWVRVPDAAALDVEGPLTIEAWIRAEAEGGGIVNKWGDIGINDRSYSIEYRGGGQIQFGLARDDNQLDSTFHDFESGAVPLATWHHVACVYDGVSRKTYMDGVLVGERATTGLVHVGTTDLSIGAHLRSNAGPIIAPFQGRIDEVRIWSTARTPTEIRRWINETIGSAQVASHPGLVAAWNFDGTTSDATGLHDGVAQGTISYVSSADIPRLYDCDNDGVNDLQEIAADPLLDVNGNGVPDSCECVATSYCVGAPNSVGPGARIALVGLPSVSLNSMTLLCSQLPPSSSGRFFYGPNQIQVPFGNGYRCVGGATYRLPVTLSGPTGTAARSLDLQNPMPGAPTLLPGSTWNFQYWYRNVAAGGAGFNLSDGLAVRFCP